jgi:hypothetical protein
MRVQEEGDTTRASLGFEVMSVVMIVLGIAEAATSFRHRFSIIATTASVTEAVAGVSVGACYIAAGSLIFKGRQRAARMALILLILDVLVRIGMVMGYLFPVSTSTQVIRTAGGMVIALTFTLILAVKLPSLPE